MRKDSRESEKFPKKFKIIKIDQSERKLDEWIIKGKEREEIVVKIEVEEEDVVFSNLYK